jgi:hypothetical protein
LTILTRRASHPLDGEPSPGSQLLSRCPFGAEQNTFRDRS